MSFSDEFQAVELKALRDNTALDVFNNLKDVVNHASLHASRWIWELIQNGRDATPPGSPLHISVSIGEDLLSFRHNGMAFTPDQVAHLIHHGSTKQEGQLGRFGTGFLSTHIISKTPRVSGRFSDGRGFTFILDRTGDTANDLSESMARSSKEFVASVGKNSQAISLGEYSTRYDYPLTADVRQIAQQGIGSLESYAPYVLAFNHEIDSIEIVKENERRRYKRRPATLLNAVQGESPSGSAMTTQVDVETSSEEENSTFVVATLTRDTLTVAILAQLAGDNHRIMFGPEVPKLFMAFPLFGTESMGFPGVMNSREFRPLKDRNGLYLGPDTTDDNAANKQLVEQACPLFVDLMEQCTRAKWTGIDVLCRLTTSAPRGVDEKWLYELVKNSLVTPLRAIPLVTTCGGQMIVAEDAWIPLGSTSVPSSSLWQLLREHTASDEQLVNEAIASSWESNVRAWASVLKVPPEEMRETYILSDFADQLVEFGSLEGVRQALRDGCDHVKWCTNVFGLLMQADLTPLFDKLAILPDQHGKFRTRKSLRLDRDICEELKDIGQVLGLSIRSGLLHQDVASADLRTLFTDKTPNEVLVEIIDHLGDEADKDRPVAGFRQGNVELFAWILEKDTLDHLESFPALTQEPPNDGEPPSVVYLEDAGEPETIALAPPECWPEGAAQFSALFPMRRVLASDYYRACKDTASWVRLAARGFVRVTPSFEMEDYVDDFLPDDTLTDDDTHKSTRPVRTTKIAFLTEKDIGLIDVARKNEVKCLLFLRFLAAYMIRVDKSWNERVPVECECGNTHRILKAGWVIPLKPKKRKWIYVGRNHSDHLSVDSLATLLKDDREIVALLAEGQGPAFLAVLGVSAGDFPISTMVNSPRNERPECILPASISV
jgi:hypothetical protein